MMNQPAENREIVRKMDGIHPPPTPPLTLAKPRPVFGLWIETADEATQKLWFERLAREGIACRIVTW